MLIDKNLTLCGKSDRKYENHRCNRGFYSPLKCNINCIAKCKKNQCDIFAGICIF